MAETELMQLGHGQFWVIVATTSSNSLTASKVDALIHFAPAADGTLQTFLELFLDPRYPSTHCVAATSPDMQALDGP